MLCIHSGFLLAVMLFTVSLVGCSDTPDPGAKFNILCEENGLCECVSNSQCGSGQICFNGTCYTVEPELEDALEEGSSGPVDLSTDVLIEPGKFKAPCVTDEDCDSHICVEISPGVGVCSVECIDDCPDDWECRGVSQDSDVVIFLCMPKQDRLCQPCMADVSCTGSKNLCLDVGGLLSCGRDCSQIACPNGYACQDATSIEGVDGKQCVPESGHCQCTPENVGNEFQCTVDNEFGSCPGHQVCLEGGSLTECDGNLPEAESCDNKDNNCNGFVDEDVATTPCTKENEHGVCPGEIVCILGTGEVCNAGEPKPEVCDGQDNDCDGEIDEDYKDEFGMYGLLNHCAGCFLTCQGQFAHATEITCDATSEEPYCRIVTCESGYLLVDETLCLPAIHHLCEPCSSDEACVGPDDKCMLMNPTDTQTFCGRDCSEDSQYATGCPNGYFCKEVELADGPFEQCVPINNTCDCTALTAGQEKPCTVTNEFGMCYGVAVCDPIDGWTGCSSVTPEEEICDGFDNNCNGIIDEGLSGNHCKVTNEFGACSGTQICLGQEGHWCTAKDPEDEVCDGEDNDCDKEIDEPFATNIKDDDDKVIAVIYDLTNDNCGGCGLPCFAVPPASAAQCTADGLTAHCKITDCAEGYYPSGLNSCMPIPAANLCLPCTNDADCLGPNDACLTYPVGDFCGRDCSADSIYTFDAQGNPVECTGEEGQQGCCPHGYLCTDQQCRRESADCDCNSAGKMRVCKVNNEFGVCSGLETCVETGPGAGWKPCDAATPEQEICDGKDNDCDGVFDAFDDSVDASGLVGYPNCQNVSEACPGKWTCALVDDEFQWFCSAQQPADEMCNGFDDDCDGDVDEGFTDAQGQFTLLAHCGGCGLDCAQALTNLATDAQGQLVPGAVACEQVDGKQACVPKQCAPGYYLFPSAQQASICLELNAANCQPCAKDGDCPGIGHACTQVGTDDGQYCAQRCDAAGPYPDCAGQQGFQGCCPNGFVCDKLLGQPQGQLHCMSVTDTCQCSAANEGMERPCTLDADGGLTTCFGISSCQPEGNGFFAWGDCDTSANTEVCDGLDNDCNGTADDGFLTDGEYADNEHCGECGKNCALKWSPEQQHVVGVCNKDLPGGPDCVVGGCLDTKVGGGTPCTSDGDCAGDEAGPTCLPDFFQCGTNCTNDAQCAAGDCIDGSCAPPCNENAQCAAMFGDWSTCGEGHCRTTYQYVDRDDWTGNGCECPAAVGMPIDQPDVFDVFPLPGAVYVDRNCDGVDGDVATALFVSADTLGGDGSYAAPFGSIQQALDAFDAGMHSHVLVATGNYDEQVVLKNGVLLYGGYSPDFLQRDVAMFPTVVKGPPPDFANPAVIHGTVNAANITTQTVIAGFSIYGYDVPATQAAAGRTAYAVYISGSSSALLVTNNWIIGGQGGPGIDGANGQAGTPGQPGGIGNNSAECINGITCTGNGCNQLNCSGHLQAGGAAGTNPSCATAKGCEGMESEGGDSPQQKDNPQSGCTYSSGGTAATYWGGPSNLCKYDCFVNTNMLGYSGIDGGPGYAGDGGTGCTGGFGAIADGDWVGPNAAAGQAGTAGKGGQGGGAGANINNSKSAACNVGNHAGDLGASGGGGGAGGCGGHGGAPGQHGGASIAVMVASGANGSFPGIPGNLVTRGYGGPGGPGGNGGTGGKGGTGGLGGTSGTAAWCAGKGGSGGRGGDGGAGGGGGGGCGGAAIGIAVVGTQGQPYEDSNAFTLENAQATGGTGGAGGISIDPADNGTPGTTGPSQNVRSYQ